MPRIAPPLPRALIDHLRPAAPTQVYATYWQFAAERQKIYLNRVLGKAPPWTDDPILQTYRFTNVFRASDRVSQYLIKNVIYEGKQTNTEVFFRVLLFKIFNKIETWEALSNELGSLSAAEFSFGLYDKILTKLRDSGIAIYSGAYIMPSGGGAYGYDVKHRNHLKLITNMLEDDAPGTISKAKSLQEVYQILRSYVGLGRFLAYQYTIDLNYSDLVNFSEMEFVVAGPGAEDGISKCFSTKGGLNNEEIIQLVTKSQQAHTRYLDVEFPSLWGRPLQLIDCQNLFCEISKYARVAHPEVLGISGRKRIKQTFSPLDKPVEVWFPPKWGLNENIQRRRTSD